MKKILYTLLLIVTGTGFSLMAQNKLSAAQKDLLLNTWYESPHESSGDTIMYKLTKHIHTPGKDDPSMSYSVLTLKTAPDFSAEFWRWCPKNPLVFDGKWSLFQGNIIKLDFGAKIKCKFQLTVITVEKDRLKVIVKSM